jgi:hypothetical protein
MFIAEHPDYTVAYDQWKIFRLMHLMGNGCRKVKFYEVTLDKSTSAQSGWMPRATSDRPVAVGEEKGVGYLDGSIALDCLRCGISQHSIQSWQSPSQSGRQPREAVRTNGIRCEDFGKKWYVK